MKKLLVISMVQFSLLNLFAEQNRVEDFRDVVWGTPLEAAYRGGEKLDFIKVKGPLANNSYYLKNDPMSIGTVKLNSIHYHFSEEDDKFFKVELKGDRKFIDDMIFILNYKFGEFENKSEVDGVKYFQWIVQDVTFTLSQFEARDFELSVQSDWETAQKYKKNTSVEDF